MRTNLCKLVLTLMSLTLLVGNTFICIDEHGGLNVSFLHGTHVDHSAQISDPCCDDHSSDICYDEHQSCGDVVIDFDSAVTAPSNLLGSLVLSINEPVVTFPNTGKDTYRSKLYQAVSPPPILEQLSTVVLTT